MDDTSSEGGPEGAAGGAPAAAPSLAASFSSKDPSTRSLTTLSHSLSSSLPLSSSSYLASTAKSCSSDRFIPSLARQSKSSDVSMKPEPSASLCAKMVCASVRNAVSPCVDRKSRATPKAVFCARAACISSTRPRSPRLGAQILPDRTGPVKQADGSRAPTQQTHTREERPRVFMTWVYCLEFFSSECTVTVFNK
jgi:hypothetical protein